MAKRVYKKSPALSSDPLLASELIRQLRAAIEKHGDVPVRVWDEQMRAPQPFILEPPSDYARWKYPETWPCLTIRRKDRSIEAMDDLDNGGDDKIDT